MALRSKQQEQKSEQLRNELLKIITDFEAKLSEENVREQVRALIPAHHTLAALGCSLIPEDSPSAKARILAYLIRFPRTLISGEELMVVAGISEYARRIRELRVQEGYAIVSGLTYLKMMESGEVKLNDVDVISKRDLKPDAYILLSTELDRQAAHRWHSASRIRKSDLSVKDKIIEYLRANVGNMVSGEELQYLTPTATEWARRVRELRTEEGWPIATRNSGNPNLPVGFYVLEEDRQAAVHDRKIPDLVRVEVLERDNHRCRRCGWGYEKNKKNDPRNLLELHHITHHQHGGTNVVGNLITLCNVCHDGVHSNQIPEQELSTLLSEPIKNFDLQ
ncbi:HNH endonuclease [Cycloclasticus pugetii]|uniref:HNH endonuclease n=1 Tax=Cycloclasticus pugetii TaxID=34068 RepID=UPI003A8CB246